MTSFLGNSSSDDVVTKYDLGTTLVELAGNILGGAAQTTNGMGASLGKNKSQVRLHYILMVVAVTYCGV